MRILGIDFGEKRIGLALSDPLGIMASPLEVFEYSSLKSVIAKITELIKKRNIEEVVVGLPLQMNGSRGEKAEEAEAFAAALRETIDIPVICRDERLTTVQAQRALLEGNVGREQRRTSADKVAAALLLQSYLDTPRDKKDSPQ